jgi:hypothetical protein
MDFQTLRDYQWNKSFEPGLPTDKEILKDPDNQRIWVVQAAMARVISELVALVESETVKKPSKK